VLLEVESRFPEAPPRAGGRIKTERWRITNVLLRRDYNINHNNKNHIWIKLLGLTAFIGAISFATYHYDFVSLCLDNEKLLNFMDSLGPWAFVVFILLQIFQVVAAPVPGEATGILGGYLYGPYLGTLLSTVGLTVGSYVAFAVARYLGRPFVERFISTVTLERFDYLLHHKGAFLVFLLFLIPGFPKDALCYLLGLGHLSTLEFLVIGGAGRLVGTILLTLEGTCLRSQHYGMFYLLVAIGLVIVFVVMAYKDKLERLFREWYTKKTLKKETKFSDKTEQ
jgi:uncharacterized membrane protein YdjX (TVP38/TMEM64 family)